MSAGKLIADARARHGLDQRALARRAGTSQAQISRIERGRISPSVATLERLLTSMGERLELDTGPLPHGNRSTAELRADYENLSPGERVLEAARLSAVLTGLAAAGDQD